MEFIIKLVGDLSLDRFAVTSKDMFKLIKQNKDIFYTPLGIKNHTIYEVITEVLGNIKNFTIISEYDKEMSILNKKTEYRSKVHFFRQTVIPEELILEVFSHLNLASLESLFCATKKWKALESNVWKQAIYREVTFGNEKWSQCFGKDIMKDEDSREEFATLPLLKIYTNLLII